MASNKFSVKSLSAQSSYIYFFHSHSNPSPPPINKNAIYSAILFAIYLYETFSFDARDFSLFLDDLPCIFVCTISFSLSHQRMREILDNFDGNENSKLLRLFAFFFHFHLLI